MKTQVTLGKKGVTLIELLIALVIGALVIAGIYRVFITQTRAYTVQDQVAEVQQNVRGAMEFMLRDLRMAGCNDDNLASAIEISNPVSYPVSDNSITINYEYYDRPSAAYQLHSVRYFVNGSNLVRQLTVDGAARPQETLIENLDRLNFTYGVDGIRNVDESQDKAVDDQNGNSVIDGNDWVTADTVNGGNLHVIAVRVSLSGGPSPVNPDVQQAVSPRTLMSSVSLHNMVLIQ